MWANKSQPIYIFDSIFEEVTLFKPKTNMSFLEHNTYTLEENNENLEISGP